MGKRLLFIYNPHSGRGMIKVHLSDIIETMVRAGYEVTVYPTQRPKDAEQKAAEYGSSYERIVVSGGDGTLDEVVTGLMPLEKKSLVGYIPAGSTNDYASSLGLESDMLKAADTAVNGIPAPVDIGMFGDTYFVYVAAFGIFTETSYTTSQQLKNVLGHAAYVLSAFKQLKDIPSYQMQVEYDGNVLYDEFIYGMVTNTVSVGGMKGLISGEVDLNDGLFEVTLIKMPKNPFDLSQIVSSLTGLDTVSDMVTSFQTSDVKFSSVESVPWTLDGEYGGKPKEVEIKALHGAISIVS